MEKIFYLVSNSLGSDFENSRAQFTCQLPEKIANKGALAIKLLNISFENSFFIRVFHIQALNSNK